MFLLSILIQTAFAEDAILTDRPSVGTSGLVLNKGSIQLESGAQRVSTDSYCGSTNCPSQYVTSNMIRIGVTPKFEIRPYNDWNFSERSQSTTGVQGKINLYSSDENSHAAGILVSSGFSSGQNTSTVMALVDIGGDLASGWLNAGVNFGNQVFSQSIILGVGADKVFAEVVIDRPGGEQDVGLCVGAVYPFANYQIDLFVLQGFDSITNQQAGIGFSWQIK